MEAQIPATYLQSAIGCGGRFFNFTTTYQEQIPAAQFVNEGDNFGSVTIQQSRYYMAC